MWYVWLSLFLAFAAVTPEAGVPRAWRIIQLEETPVDEFWSDTVTCPGSQLIRGFQIRVKPVCNNCSGTLLNGIRFICETGKDKLTLTSGEDGTWQKKVMCDGEEAYLKAFKLKYVLFPDKTQFINSVTFRCETDGKDVFIEGNKSPARIENAVYRDTWWSSGCGRGYAINGFQAVKQTREITEPIRTTEEPDTDSEDGSGDEENEEGLVRGLKYIRLSCSS